MSTAEKIRVFQVATGNLGTEMIGRIQDCLLYTSPSPRDS